MTIDSTLHTARLLAWVRYNGQMGTEKQVERARRSFPLATSERLAAMLAERGIHVVWSSGGVLVKQ